MMRQISLSSAVKIETVLDQIQLAVFNINAWASRFGENVCAKLQRVAESEGRTGN